jgi:hypothetical protein
MPKFGNGHGQRFRNERITVKDLNEIIRRKLPFLFRDRDRFVSVISNTAPVVP